MSVMTSAFATVIVVLISRDGALGVELVILVSLVAAVAYRGYASTRRRHQSLELMHSFVADGVGAESVNALTEQLLEPHPHPDECRNRRTADLPPEPAVRSRGGRSPGAVGRLAGRGGADGRFRRPWSAHHQGDGRSVRLAHPAGTHRRRAGPARRGTTRIARSGPGSRRVGCGTPSSSRCPRNSGRRRPGPGQCDRHGETSTFTDGRPDPAADPDRAPRGRLPQHPAGREAGL